MLIICGGLFQVVENCYNCGNCKEGNMTYYCLSKNEIVINENIEVIEKSTRMGWKKGTKEYENHRRKTRSEVSEG